MNKTQTTTITLKLTHSGWNRHQNTGPLTETLWNTKKGHKITITHGDTRRHPTTLTIQTRHHNPKTNKTTYKTTHTLKLEPNQTWTTTTTLRHNQTDPPLTTQQLITYITTLPPTPKPPPRTHYIQNLILQQTKNKLNQTTKTTTFTHKAHKPEQPATIKIQTKYHQAQLTIQPPTNTTTTNWNPTTKTKETNHINNPGHITTQHGTEPQTHQTPTPTYENPKYNPDTITEYAQHILQQLQQLDNQYHKYQQEYTKTKLTLHQHQNNLYQNPIPQL